MSSTTDGIKGYASAATGMVEEAVGHSVGSASMEADGLVQQAEREAQKATGDIKRTR